MSNQEHGRDSKNEIPSARATSLVVEVLPDVIPTETVATIVFPQPPSNVLALLADRANVMARVFNPETPSDGLPPDFCFGCGIGPQDPRFRSSRQVCLFDQQPGLPLLFRGSTSGEKIFLIVSGVRI